MNSIDSSRITSLRPLGFAFALALIGSAYAGPGLDYWQSRSGSTDQTQKSVPAKAERPARNVCTDSKVVPITTMQPNWHNGRGPLHEVQIGSKRVCTSCGSFVVMKPSGANGRGPLQPTKVSGRHDCDSTCAAPEHS